MVEVTNFDSFKRSADSIYLILYVDIATDQNIENKTLALEIGTAYGRYTVDCEISPRKILFLELFLTYKCMYKKAITGGFICSRQNLFWKTKSWRYSILSSMKIENCWKLKLLKFLQVLLTVPVITFSDTIFCFALF